MSRRGPTPLALYTQHRVRQWLEEHPEQSQSDLARLLGGTKYKSNVNQLLGPACKCGHSLAQRFAERVFGETLGEWVTKSEAWYEAQGADRRGPARWPNLSKAIQVMSGSWTLHTRETLLEYGSRWPRDRQLSDWIEEGEQLDKAFRELSRNGGFAIESKPSNY